MAKAGIILGLILTSLLIVEKVVDILTKIKKLKNDANGQ